MGRGLVVFCELPLSSAVLLKFFNYSSTIMFIVSQPRTQVESVSLDSFAFWCYPYICDTPIGHNNKSTSHTFVLRKTSQDIKEKLRVQVGACTSSTAGLKPLLAQTLGPKIQVTSNSSNNENKQLSTLQLMILACFKKI